MRKLIVASTLLSNLTFAQIGVNTNSPKSTFDINAKNKTGTTEAPEGILVPRVDRQRAQSMNNLETSTLVYVNSIATGSQTGIAINIDKEGYYYFDGTAWVKLTTDYTDSENTNIYNKDGSLTENRIVTQGDKTLSFTGNSINSFSVDGSTLSVDAANHRIGIGTTSPNNKLTVKGENAQPNFTNAATLRVDGNTNHALDMGTFAEAPWGAYLSSNNKQDKSMPLILNPLGSNVGIGTNSPSTSAILELAATDKGFLPPRLTTTQRDALTPKTEGLMIYNSSVNIMQYWNGTTWINYQ